MKLKNKKSKSSPSICKTLKGTIDCRPQSEAILRRIGSPMADQVVGILQQVEGMKNLE